MKRGGVREVGIERVREGERLGERMREKASEEGLGREERRVREEGIESERVRE